MKRVLDPQRRAERWAMSAAWVFAAAAAVLTFLVMRYVKLYGDDYFYGTFWAQGWDSFCEANKNHYLYSNGRAIVHMLDAITLQWPPLVWQILNCAMLGALVFLGVRTVLPASGKNFAQVFCGAAVLCAMILYLDIRVTNQSVYWETGSWNYIYPFVLLLGTWVVLERRRNGKGNPVALSVLALLSAATTEQNAMMTVGLVFLYLADSWWIRREKADRAMLWALGFAVFGALTVLAAPSQWTRFADEQQGRAEVSMGELLVNNFKEQGTLFFTGVYMKPYQTMALAGSIIFLFSVSNRLKLVWNVLVKMLAVLGFAVIGMVFYFSGEYDEPIVHRTLACVLIFGYHLVSGAILFWYMLKYRPKQYCIPLITVILAAGSQIMMLVSPMFGSRTVLCAIFLMGIYAAFMVVHFLPFQTGKPETKVFLVLLSVVMLGNAFLIFWPTVRGYRENAGIDGRNRVLIQEYHAQGEEELVQYRMYHDFYAWSLPYNSPYHEEWYKIYYGLPEDLIIRWESPETAE